MYLFWMVQLHLSANIRQAHLILIEWSMNLLFAVNSYHKVDRVSCINRMLYFELGALYGEEKFGFDLSFFLTDDLKIELTQHL